LLCRGGGLWRRVAEKSHVSGLGSLDGEGEKNQGKRLAAKKIRLSARGWAPGTRVVRRTRMLRGREASGRKEAFSIKKHKKLKYMKNEIIKENENIYT
jgi:hypothetical protein